MLRQKENNKKWLISGCGVGKYPVIRYSQNGSVAEEVERIECNGSCSK